MKVLNALFCSLPALVLLSTAVMAEAAPGDAYKEVLLPGTTVVAGYPDANDFIIATEKEIPALFAEQHHLRALDEAKVLAASHQKEHLDIRLTAGMMTALNVDIKKAFKAPPPTIPKVSLVENKKKLIYSKFNFASLSPHPATQVCKTGRGVKMTAAIFASKSAAPLSVGKKKISARQVKAAVAAKKYQKKVSRKPFSAKSKKPIQFVVKPFIPDKVLEARKAAPHKIHQTKKKVASKKMKFVVKQVAFDANHKLKLVPTGQS